MSDIGIDPLIPKNGGTGVSNNNASTFAISGNFPLTATLTGATNVTFPTSGTLATTAGAGIGTLNGDSGSATGSSVTIKSGNVGATGISGTNNGTLTFVGSGSTLSVAQSDPNENTGFGYSVFGNPVSGLFNTAFGSPALGSLTSGNHNTALGAATLGSIVSGSDNIAIGFNSGSSCVTGTESSNILIANVGANAESHALRIGTAGSGAGQQNTCYIAGITGVAVAGTTPQVVLCNTSGQLGAISSSTSGFVLTSNGAGAPSFQAASGGITTLNGNSGSATGSTVTVTTGTSNTQGTATFTGSSSTLTFAIADANVNVGLGVDCLKSVTSGSVNVAIGYQCLKSITSGISGNVAIGNSVASLVTADMSHCVLIGEAVAINASDPVGGGSNSSYSVAIGASTISTMTTGRFAGSVAIGGGSSGCVSSLSTGDANNVVAIGNGALGGFSTGSVAGSVAIGQGSMAGAFNSSTNDVAIGHDAMNGSGATVGCIALGATALNIAANTGMIGIGTNTLASAASASDYCIAIGYQALQGTSNSTKTIAIGYRSGNNYTGGENSCILLNASGTAAESNVCRIGDATGTGAQQLNATFIHGIAGTTVASTAAVLVNTSTGQLGTIISSRRFKENIEDIGDDSTFIQKLRPVKFTLKSHPEYGQQTGLIAEEVMEVAPQLVCFDPEGSPASVSYHQLPALLLNELQKLTKRVNELEAKGK